MRTWPNGAFGGNYVQTIVPALKRPESEWEAHDAVSIEVLGTLTLPTARGPGDRWLIECDARGGSFFLWLDDHLVCEAGNMQPRWNQYRVEAVLPFTHTLHEAAERATTGGGSAAPTRYFLRATFVRHRHHIVAAPREKPFVEMRWQRSASPPRCGASC